MGMKIYYDVLCFMGIEDCLLPKKQICLKHIKSEVYNEKREGRSIHTTTHLINFLPTLAVLLI